VRVADLPIKKHRSFGAR